MARSVVKTSAAGRGPVFLLVLAVVIYAMFSIATAMTNIKDCEPNGKHWSFFPPHWICDSPTNVSPN
jgi:hypothetical protein